MKWLRGPSLRLAPLLPVGGASSSLLALRKVVQILGKRARLVARRSVKACQKMRRFASSRHIGQAADHSSRTDELCDVARIRRIARVWQIAPCHGIVFLIVCE